MLRAELLSCELRLVPVDLESSEGIACCTRVAALAWGVRCRAALLWSCPISFPELAEGDFLTALLGSRGFCFSPEFL